eukprot:2166800-Pleurochrysis_carterae.AAC.1
MGQWMKWGETNTFVNIAKFDTIVSISVLSSRIRCSACAGGTRTATDSPRWRGGALEELQRTVAPDVWQRLEVGNGLQLERVLRRPLHKRRRLLALALLPRRRPLPYPEQPRTPRSRGEAALLLRSTCCTIRTQRMLASGTCRAQATLLEC